MKPTPPKRYNVPIEVAENAEAKREYLRVCGLLDGKMDERDRSLLVDYALTHAEIITLRASVDIEGYTCIGEKGGSYVNPTVNVMTSRITHLSQLRRDLYFTPRSRIEKKTNPKSKSASIRDNIGKGGDE